MRSLLLNLGAATLALGALLAGPAAAETDTFRGTATLTVSTDAQGRLSRPPGPSSARASAAAR
jgi:hypothetical protein